MCIRKVAGACLIVLACASFAAAQQPATSPEPGSTQQPSAGEKAGDAKDQKPAEQVDVAEESPVYKEQVVVSASKSEEALVNAPAAVSIINSQTIINTASSSYADVFRSVPGVNVTQTSARDINITSRGATSTLSTSQLALIDGRSIYLDFFGFIAWDFLPVNPAEIKQIEVIRGPASAIWGANALSGVVNVITKTPRELQGSSFTIGFGGFNRESSNASRTPARCSTCRVRTRRPSTSAGRTRSRPVSTRRTRCCARAGRCRTTPARLSDYTNTGHEAAEVRLRVDRDYEDGKHWCSRAASPAPRHHPQRHWPLRHRQRHRPHLRQGQLQQGAYRVELLHEHPRRQRHQPVAFGTNGQPLAVRVQEHDLRRRGGQHRTSAARTSSPTAATSGTTASTCRSRRPATPGPRPVPTGRTRSSSPSTSAGSSARASTSSRTSTTRSSRRARRFMLKPSAVADGAAVVQPRVPRAVAHQQLPRHRDRQPARSGAVQSGAGR